MDTANMIAPIARIKPDPLPKASRERTPGGRLAEAALPEHNE
jgi:hypothetical protein